MPVVDSTTCTHMGILRISTNQEIHAVKHNNIQIAKRTACSLMGPGLHGGNGMDPETAISLLNTHVFPVLFHEVIVPTGKAFSVLKTLYKRLLNQVLSLPTTVVDPTIHCLSGALTGGGVIHDNPS